ncbi:TetR/AcrR family transcriptional regulator [Bailinhaonella thermotolerans]|uniref:TetR/AcrR family transcriptional regulator n=1 Tax=Bailinhaonella thermotolerans TaxID=1070861 RepID=UPI00192A26EE|nr:TetR/AcrR family transcriptional regulator [Bailinhaonella thermotolerans]
MARTQEQRKAETRRRLIDAAADLFARKGYAGVSAEAVADAADRTTGALYKHFGGKEGLLLALLEVWKEETVEVLTAAFERMPALDERLTAIWRSLNGAQGRRGDAWLLLEMELWLQGVRDPVMAEPLAERYRDIRRRLGEGLRDWAEQTGAPLRHAPDDAAALVLGLIVGAAVQHRLDPSTMPDDLLLAGLADLIGTPSAARRQPD